MNKEEYQEKVHDVATTILTQCNAIEWKKENEDGEFAEFEDEMEYDGSITNVIDSLCELSDWRDAVGVLQATEQNPDHVDSGLYEGCGWERILIVIAFEVFRWDVYGELEELFNDEDGFEEAVLAYPDTKTQLGFYPSTKKFKIPSGPRVVAMGDDGIKILVHSGRQDFAKPSEPIFSVVFEGKVAKRGSGYIVSCWRVYNQTHTDIKEDLKRCMEEFGVEEIGDG